jgi:hypothetical protein
VTGEPKKQFADSDDLCRYVARLTGGRVLLSFSCGKDALGGYLQLRRHFTTIDLLYLYLIPGLSFVEEALAYYEQTFGQHITRLPHPSLYRMLNEGLYQTPDRYEVIRQLDLPDFDYDDCYRVYREDHGLDESVFAASGVRAADSPDRRVAIKRHGPVNYSRRSFFPVYDWNKARLLDEIRASGIKLSGEYRLFGRSFDGIDYRFIKPIRDQYPADYERIKQFFPLIDVELHRYERRADGWDSEVLAVGWDRSADRNQRPRRRRR